MKTYCKRLLVSDQKKIYDAITDYMHGKHKKNSSIRFFMNYTGKSREFIREHLQICSGAFDEKVAERYESVPLDKVPEEHFNQILFWKLASAMAYHIRNRTVKEHLLNMTYGLPLIRYVKINDPGSGKERMLGLETILFRLYEAVAAKAAEPMFSAKIGMYQCASIKGRGQNYGKKAIVRWTSRDVDGTRYNAKADVKKCYPSISHDKLLSLLSRDLRKSDELLYLFTVFIELYQMFPSPEAIAPDRGILIGSPVSKDLCNYFLSYAYHYASEQLFKETRRRGQMQVKRLISHIIFYMDDITIYSGNKKDLRLSVTKLIAYMRDFLDLTIKSDWIIQKTMYLDGRGKIRGGILDFMGFRFHGGEATEQSYYGRQQRHKKVWITMRKNIFLTARRKISKLLKSVKKKIPVKIKFAKSVISVFGWYKNTNMFRYRIRNGVDKAVRIARNIVSDAAKGKMYATGKYYEMWRRFYA